MNNEVHNIDCLEYMKTLPDKFFDLAIADPPYGIGEDGAKNHSRSKMAKAQEYAPKEWDRHAPGTEFFYEVRRVSKNQIIWGANHFISRIPFDSPCWIVWDKENGENDFADCELAWSSFPTAVRRFKFRWAGMLQGNMAHKESRIHPTQKPVALYAWILKNYAQPGDKIFDPMMGSQSSRIAAYKMGFDYVGCELDPDYFAAGCARFDRECRGIERINGKTITQQSLF